MRFIGVCVLGCCRW